MHPNEISSAQTKFCQFQQNFAKTSDQIDKICKIFVKKLCTGNPLVSECIKYCYKLSNMAQYAIQATHPKISSETKDREKKIERIVTQKRESASIPCSEILCDTITKLNKSTAAHICTRSHLTFRYILDLCFFECGIRPIKGGPLPM